MKIVNPITQTPLLINLSVLLARVGLSAIFILAAINKVQFYDGNAAYMASAGLPANLLPLVIAFEFIAGAFILSGLLTQLSAVALAGFSIVSGLLFHFDLADQMQFILFFKNVAMAGGFLALAASGAGKYSLDNLLTERFAAR